MKNTIGLSMVVKNEAHVIERCFDSILKYPLIDYYYIVDTGSEDGTQEVIRKYFAGKNIPGEVVDYPFVDDADKKNHTEIRGIVDFRNMALSGLTGKTDYIFWIDADEQFDYSPEFNLHRFQDKIKKYDFLYFRCMDKGFSFRNNHLIRTSLGWEWHGYAHEYLRVKKSNLNLKSSTIDDCTFIYNEDGASWKNKDAKISKYINLLTKQHEEEPKDGRWLFYLGQSYRALETDEGKRKAIECFEKRTKLWKGGNSGEAYVSKLLSVCLKQELAGDGDSIGAEDFNECAKYDSNRIEHFVYANKYYWDSGDYQTAYKYSSKAVRLFNKPPYEISETLLELSVYNFTCAYIHAVNCEKTGRKKEGLEIIKKLIDNVESGKSLPTVPFQELIKIKNALSIIDSPNTNMHTEPARIGLSMIVKNEAHVIKRCFDSIMKKPLLDYYYIVDTGSTDGTQEIIRKYFAEKNIPGEVIDYPFTNFADCRNKALEGIKDKCDYVFRIDADEELTYLPEFSIERLKKDIFEYDFLLLRIQRLATNQYTNIQFIKTSLNWEWHGFVHEHLQVKGVDMLSLNSALLESVIIIYNEDGASWKAGKPGKYKKYVELLEKQIAEEPNNPRWLFYMAQSYIEVGGEEGTRKAIEYYEKRAAASNDEEGCIAEFYALSFRKEKLGEDVPPQKFVDCSLIRLGRIEPLMYVINYYQHKKNLHAAYIYASFMYQSFLSPPYGKSESFLDITVYSFSCCYMYAIACLYTNRKKEGLSAIKRLEESIKNGTSPLMVKPEEFDLLKNNLSR